MISSLLEACNLFEKLAQVQSEPEEENPFLDQKSDTQITQKDIDDISRYNKSLGNEFWRRFLEMAEKISNDKSKEAVLKVANTIAKIINRESGFDPRAQGKDERGRIVAKGLHQMLKSTAVSLGMTPEQWDNLDSPSGLSAIEQLKYVQKSFSFVNKNTRIEDAHARNFGGYYNKQKDEQGNEIAYASEEYMKHSGKEHPNPEFQAKAYRANIGLDVIIGPNGKLILDQNGKPKRKGYISKNDLSDAADKARQQYAQRKK